MSHRDTVAGYPLLLAVLVLLAGLPRPAASQAAPAGWAVAAEAGIQAFSAIAARRAESATSLVPRAAMVTGASLARRYRGWELEAGVGLITTALAVEDAGLTVVARDASISRARLRLMASLRVARLGQAEVWVSAGPSLERWSPRGAGARNRAGASAAVRLRLDAGPFVLENAATVGIARSPLESNELPNGYELRPVRSAEIGLGVRIGL